MIEPAIKKLNLHTDQEKALNNICVLVYYHNFESLKGVAILSTDTEKKSKLIRIEFATKIGNVWLREDGSVTTETGTKIFLKDGKRPSKSPKFSDVFKNK